jgi:hypothetical protein
MSCERESGDGPLPAELAALEQRLAAMVPAPPRIERDELMFAAGRASVECVVHPVRFAPTFWPVAATLATAASIVLATMLVWQRGETTHLAVTTPDDFEAPVVVDLRLDRRGSSDRVPSGYLGKRQVVLTRGVAALEYQWPMVGASESDAWSPPMTARQLRDELLPKSGEFDKRTNPARIL